MITIQARSAPPTEDPDVDLLVLVGTGDERAFRTLVSRKLGRIHGLAQRLLGDPEEADDVSQEALLRVWRQAGRWLPGAARFDTWLHRVVLNLCIDRLRRRREVPMAEPPEQIDPALPVDRRMARDEMIGRVKAAIATLPSRQSEALMLHMYQELSNIETAAVMGISIDALESLLSRARRSLRTLLEGV